MMKKMVNYKFEKGNKAIAREPYAVTVAFLLLLIKGGLLYKRAAAGR